MEPTSPSSPVSEAPSDQSSQDSYVKLAMRNMVRKSGKSIFHFTLTTTAILGILVGLAYLTR